MLVMPWFVRCGSCFQVLLPQEPPTDMKCSKCGGVTTCRRATKADYIKLRWADRFFPDDLKLSDRAKAQIKAREAIVEMTPEARAAAIAAAPWAYSSRDISAIIEELLVALRRDVALGVEVDSPGDGGGKGGDLQQGVL